MSELQARAGSYTEDMYLLNEQRQLNESEQKAVDEALLNNSAVGVVSGTYDEHLTILMASGFFLSAFKVNIDDVSESKGASLLDYVDDESAELFKPENFKKISGRFEFVGKNAAGEQCYVFAYKSESIGADGQAQWTLSTRVSYESIGVNKFLHALSHLVRKYVICDLKKNQFDFYRYKDGETYQLQGTYDSLYGGIVTELGLTSNLDTLKEELNTETLVSRFGTEDGLYRFDYASEDESVFYRMAVIPQDFEDGKATRFVVFVMDVTSAHREEIRLKQALHDAYQSANKANDAKSQFLSNMSHDIRTPMNAIIGMTAIASAHIDDRDRALDALGKITTSSRHLLGLINEILDMSRIERGKMSLNDEDFSLPELVDNMIEMVKPQIISRHQTLEVNVNKIEHEDVIGDALRIQQVFTNIVSNAVKYTDDKGTIKIAITELPTHKSKIGCYEFIVEDNGIGMSEDFVKTIFEPFSRAKAAEASPIQGSGLGMSIAKNIVSMMDGDIKVDSKLGQGTKVTFTIFLQLQDKVAEGDDAIANLPVLVVDDDVVSCESTVDALVGIGMQGEWVDNGAAAIERVQKKHGSADDYYAVIVDWKMPEMDGIETTRRIRKIVGPDMTIIMLTAFDFGEIEEEAREAGVNCFISKPLFRSRLKATFMNIVTGTNMTDSLDGDARHLPIGDYTGKRALVVEDNMLNREIMIEVLGETNIEIDSAVNGKIAVDKVEEHPEGYYDIIFMDIQMPVMNGYDATVAIRSLPNGKGATVPIIALTANAFAEDVVAAKNAGANEHVAKPVDIERLGEVMRTWIN